MVSQEPQIHMEDEFLSEEDLVVSLTEQLDIIEENKDGYQTYGTALRKLKKMVPWPDDGKEHRYRIGQHLIVMKPKAGGKEVEYVTQDGFSLKVNPRENGAGEAE